MPVFLIVLAGVCLLAFAVHLRRASRKVDAILQDTQRPAVPAPTATDDPKETPAA
jgi:hypothetical protein